MIKYLLHVYQVMTSQLLSDMKVVKFIIHNY